MNTPIMPPDGTDNRRLLEAMMAAYPAPAWNVNRNLGLVGNSRASDLRDDYGWSVESVRGDRIAGSRKYVWGYQLLTTPDRWPGQTHPADADGQLRIA